MHLILDPDVLGILVFAIMSALFGWALAFDNRIDSVMRGASLPQRAFTAALLAFTLAIMILPILIALSSLPQ
jgi:ABC-type phosphate transport system permease subunit